METTTSVPTAIAPRLAGAEQVQPTPGPWYASRKHGFVMTSNYVVVAEIRGRPEQAANALLIAEAPNMLAGLKNLDTKATEAIEWLGTLKGPAAAKANQNIHAMRGVQLNARAIVSKIEGRAP